MPSLTTLRTFQSHSTSQSRSGRRLRRRRQVGAQRPRARIKPSYGGQLSASGNESGHPRLAPPSMAHNLAQASSQAGSALPHHPHLLRSPHVHVLFAQSRLGVMHASTTFSTGIFPCTGRMGWPQRVLLSQDSIPVRAYDSRKVPTLPPPQRPTHGESGDGALRNCKRISSVILRISRPTTSPELSRVVGGIVVRVVKTCVKVRAGERVASSRHCTQGPSRLQDHDSVSRFLLFAAIAHLHHRLHLRQRSSSQYHFQPALVSALLAAWTARLREDSAACICAGGCTRMWVGLGRLQRPTATRFDPTTRCLKRRCDIRTSRWPLDASVRICVLLQFHRESALQSTIHLRGQFDSYSTLKATRKDDYSTPSKQRRQLGSRLFPLRRCKHTFLGPFTSNTSLKLRRTVIRRN
ncbi:hypothetical protein C8F01DRAFT_1169635 [Mycena amicta]|nr:hypothetical protein C8F01DRAFT_1169635 [Mycena amicta]